MSSLSRNNVRITGEGRPTFLLAHGFGCDQSMWRHVEGQLARRGRVVVFDHVGAGGSDVSAYQPDNYATLHGYAADVIEICEDLDLGRVVFVGHSVSATIGVLAANARPDLFSQLVLICASPRYANTDTYVGGFGAADIDELLDLMDKNHLDWADLMAPTVVGSDHAEVQTEWRDSVCRTDPAIAKAFARVTFTSDHRADYRQVTTPTLLIDCSDDALAPEAVGRYVNDAIKGSRRIVLSAEGHCPHMTAPDEVVAAILKVTWSKAAVAA
jgi:sigma-B regulation protein RsbQ